MPTSGISLTGLVFLSRGTAAGTQEAGTTRTDMHCEPIANIVFQLHGQKRWTLVAPEFSGLLRPRISPDGRAYFFSELDPLDPTALAHVPRHEVVTNPGDILFIPPWTWHQVK